MTEDNIKAIDVLVVDDKSAEDIVLSFRMYTDKLKEAGIKLNSLEYVTSGEEGLKYYKEHTPDCILMDWQMPGIDGIETTKQIRQYAKEQDLYPVIIMQSSAYSEPFKNLAKEAGADTSMNMDVEKMVDAMIKLL